MSLYRYQGSWDPCRRGSFSSGSGYGGFGQRISYYPSYGRSYYPQTSYGGYGRGYYPQSIYGGYGRSYYPQSSFGGCGRSYYPQSIYGGYGRGYYPKQYYGGLSYGRQYGLGYGSRRGSICYEPCGYPLKRRYSCSSIDGPC